MAMVDMAAHIGEVFDSTASSSRAGMVAEDAPVVKSSAKNNAAPADGPVNGATGSTHGASADNAGKIKYEAKRRARGKLRDSADDLADLDASANIASKSSPAPQAYPVPPARPRSENARGENVHTSSGPTDKHVEGEQAKLFVELALHPKLLAILEQEGYTKPTPIQARAIPPLLAGRDVLGVAQTGTGKTAAFALPIIQKLMNETAEAAQNPTAGAGNRRLPRALILAPTRELAQQIGDSFGTYGRGTGLKHTIVYGGVSQFHQVNALKSGIDILVATPGRLMDLMQQRHIDLRRVSTFVLDEADRMLDMGFIQPIRQISSSLPGSRQTLLFSATMPKEVQHLADSLLRNPTRITIAALSCAAETVTQQMYKVSKESKQALLNHLCLQSDVTRAIVFVKTKHGADRICKKLLVAGVNAEAIHGDRNQNQRLRALDKLKNSEVTVLVATDVAARGIDVDAISHVFNFEMPLDPEAYVHRIGRTGRAGASGIAISFCGSDERGLLSAVEKLIRRPIPVIERLPDISAELAADRQANVDAHKRYMEHRANGTVDNDPDARPTRTSRGFGRTGGPSERRGSDRGRPAFGNRSERPMAREDRSMGSGMPASFPSARPQNSGFGMPPARPQADGPSDAPAPMDLEKRIMREGFELESKPRVNREEMPRRSPRFGAPSAQQGEFAARPSFNPRPSFDSRPSSNPRPSFNPRPTFNARPTHGDRPKFGGRVGFGDRPQFGGGERTGPGAGAGANYGGSGNGASGGTGGPGGPSGPGRPSFGKPHFGKPSFGKPQFGQSTFGKPGFGKPNFGKPTFGQSGPANGGGHGNAGGFGAGRPARSGPGAGHGNGPGGYSGGGQGNAGGFGGGSGGQGGRPSGGRPSFGGPRTGGSSFGGKPSFGNKFGGRRGPSR